MRFFSVISLISTLLVLSLLSSGCVTGSSKEQPVVFVTVQPERFFAERIAGDKFKVNCIVPSGVSPEMFRPSSTLAEELVECSAYLKLECLGYELKWMEKLLEHNPRKIKRYDTSNGVELLFGGNYKRVTADSKMVDPHMWSSPKQALHIAENMFDAFVELDPRNEKYFKKRYDLLVQELKATDSYLTKMLELSPATAFVVYTPSLSYLARDYGVAQMCIEGEEHATTETILEQINLASKELNIRAIFVPDDAVDSHAEEVATALGCEVVAIDLLSYEWFEEIETIANALTDTIDITDIKQDDKLLLGKR